MSRLQQFIHSAEKSSFRLWILNTVLSRVIPFNSPHHLRVKEIRPGFAVVRLPYRRSNLNHVKGIHACALSTLSEYTTGLALLGRISESEYRIILKKLDMEYHFQARMDVTATFEISDEFLNEHVYQPLLTEEAIFLKLKIPVKDTAGNHISTATMEWQIKKWNAVKLK